MQNTPLSAMPRHPGTYRRRCARRAIAAIAPALLAGACAVAHAQDATCDKVWAALAKQVATPHRDLSTSTSATRPAPTQAEILYTSNKVYSNFRGKWISRPFDPKQEMKDRDEARASNHVTCQFARDEAVDGESASVYLVHNTVDNVGTSVTQLWISKSSGLPLRQVVDIPEDKQHITVRFDYRNTQPPGG
jgi:hypothetical protein